MEIAALAGVQGFLHPSEADKLTELAAGKDVLEVGSFMGLSAYCMSTVAKSIHCVDTFMANTAGQTQMQSLTTLDAFLAATKRFNNVTHFVGTSEDASNRIVSDYDMVFLDAMHDYANVKLDISRWFRRVRLGGVMVFHDYGHADFPGVKQAVDELFGPQSNTIVTLMWMQKSA